MAKLIDILKGKWRYLLVISFVLVVFIEMVVGSFILRATLYRPVQNQANKSVKSAPSAPPKTTTLETEPSKTDRKIPPEKSTTSPQKKVLFSDTLSGPDGIVTNEYVHWSRSICPYISSTWDMTSGTLLRKNGVGYSGVPTRESNNICESASNTNSSIFRLNTKDSTFTNTATSLEFQLVKHGGGGASNNVYDGVHIWTRYVSQYALYVATISRWDGTIVIKKKVPVEIAHCSSPSNDGCYYEITNELRRADLAIPGVWHHASVEAVDDARGIPHISLYIDGNKVLEGIDNSVHGPAYHSGAVGVRADNTEFFLKNFTVIGI